jgi:hypothetical protein
MERSGYNVASFLFTAWSVSNPPAPRLLVRGEVVSTRRPSGGFVRLGVSVRALCMIIAMRGEDREVAMDYGEMAYRLASKEATPDGESAIAFAVLHLAAQIERLADCLDQITDDRPGSRALRVTVLQ